MYKVLLKDQYTSGYAKKIAGSYILVAGFLIHQYMCQYTCCIMKELGGLLMLCGRYVYGILTFVAGFLIHQGPVVQRADNFIHWIGLSDG